MYRTDSPSVYWRDQLIAWGPRVLFAILILVATHFIAKAVQWAVARGVDKVPVLKRHPQAGGESIGTELGRLAYWLVWLVGEVVAAPELGGGCSFPPLVGDGDGAGAGAVFLPKIASLILPKMLMVYVS